MQKKIKVYKNSRNMNLGTADSYGLGVENDNIVDSLFFEFDEMVEGQAVLLTSLQDEHQEYYAFPLTTEQTGYSIVVTNTMLIQPSYEIQLMVTNGDEIWHSKKYQFNVHPCLEAGSGDVPEALEIWINLIDEKIQECNNLNITASKSGNTTTIVVTDKEGESTTTYVLDGVGLNYNWSGTSLGIKRKDESNYQYVDLKGEKGEPGAIKMIIVAELPATGADDTIYLVPITPDISGNNYAEYVYINGAWELLGKIGVQVDLTDYVKNTDYATSSKGGVLKTSWERGTGMGNTGILLASNFSYSEYNNNANDYSFIGKGTLENVITGKNLETTNNKVTSLSNASTDTQYPSAKCVYDLIGNLETILETLDIGSGV